MVLNKAHHNIRACAKGRGKTVYIQENPLEKKMERVALLLLLSLLIGIGEGRKDGGIYDVLGVSRDASRREIRSAYKRLARVWHPDKNKSPQAQEKILEINKAYEVSLALKIKLILLY